MKNNTKHTQDENVWESNVRAWSISIALAEKYKFVLWDMAKQDIKYRDEATKDAAYIVESCNNYDKLREDNGFMEIELRHTKTLLASCEKALESRNEDNVALLDALIGIINRHLLF